jgi:GT2 family glycosyltransferase
MPTRNCAPYLTEAIHSVLAQSVDDLELVVYDDASPDETGEVVATVVDPRMRYYRHDVPLGVPAARNSCLDAARGRFIVWLDSDDRFLPGALASLLETIERRDSIGLVHGAFEVIGEDGRLLPPWPMPFDVDVVEPAASSFGELVSLNYITAPVMVRRECHDAVGPYATDIGPSSTDWEMWLRLSLSTDFAYIARPLAQYRQHPGSITSTTHAPGVRLRCDAAAVERVFAHCRPRIPNADAAERQARLALLAKAVCFASDAVAREAWPVASDALMGPVADAPLCDADPSEMLAGIVARDEFAFHRGSRAVLTALAPALSSSRLKGRLQQVAATDEPWQRTLGRIASVVRELVPPDAFVAAVDKWDPTLLHLAARAGCHFPDRRLIPEGYPADSERAIVHLDELRRRGIRYLVVPSAAFWWLEHYKAFAAHLEALHHSIWRDGDCVIFRLSDRAT